MDSPLFTDHTNQKPPFSAKRFRETIDSGWAIYKKGDLPLHRSPYYILAMSFTGNVSQLPAYYGLLLTTLDNLFEGTSHISMFSFIISIILEIFNIFSQNVRK